MSDEGEYADGSGVEPARGIDDTVERPRIVVRGGRRRRSKRSVKHVVALVMSLSLLVVAGATAVGTSLVYSHLNSNLTSEDIDSEIVAPRPAKFTLPNAPHQPLNILVLGEDSRTCASIKTSTGTINCDLDNQSGEGGSDTTILLHLSADRKRAYGVSIPRDTLVTRPECKSTSSGAILPESTMQMWNAAFALGGAACTVSQFETNTGIRIDHTVVVNFASFQAMTDALGGVTVCIPKTVDDPAHGIVLQAGTRKISGAQALSYVRERYGVGNGSDTGRIQRQQAFVASMVNQVLSSGTLTDPLKLYKFMDAATKSLTVDKGLSSLKQLAGLAYAFRNIGFSHIQFLTAPWMPYPEDPNRLVFTDQAPVLWQEILKDEPLSAQFTKNAIKANNIPGVTKHKHKHKANADLSASGLCS
jgi:LCP family protein required for cell wall assembly